ncbi:MAG: hypothetical protein GXZ15_00030, partial [Campylobacter sp.]|nr:hypothetical protein [Campylobacter sp.]
MRILLVFFIFFAELFAEPLDADEAFKITVTAGKDGIYLNFDIDERVYIYADQLKFKVQESDVSNFLTLPEPKKYKNSMVFDGKFDLFVPSDLILNSKSDINAYSAELYFVGCARNGFCYSPQIYRYDITKNDIFYNVKFKNLSEQTNFSSTLSSSSNKKNDELSQISEQDSISKSMSEGSFFVTLLTFFGYGLLLSMTPCIFPMIPILSSILIAKCGKDDKKRSIKKSFTVSFIYVFAMAVAYGLIGILASLLGTSLQSILQIPWIIIFFALVFVALAFSMFGFYQIQIPSWLQGKISKKSEESSGLLGVFLMGFLSALVVGPCVAAPLAGALIYIAGTGDILLGASALFIMGFAMGVPL